MGAGWRGGLRLHVGLAACVWYPFLLLRHYATEFPTIVFRTLAHQHSFPP
ncbi:expressed unknown protein [Ectocarpus siliculosus]|uniref:Uncharacterized protein n=1 Tax=Ectocarpus siliculosus TaxID=2880 RepID=D7G0S8_ECTSI|nr:expressed unknown protein [Ectocarpus siliculosus]|eukprot:CBJ26741.1 expressed unknown protein [Ectocarpus siliculosus]